MKSFAVLLAPLVPICFMSSTFAQGSDWQPSRFPPFDFRDAAAAKIYSNNSGVSVLGLVSFKEETRTVPITKIRMETRTRMVKDPDTGEALEQTYSVCVPYTEQIERAETVRRRIEVPLEDTKVWTFSGKALSAEEVRTSLSSAKRCFYTENRWIKDKYQGDPFYAEMLKPDVLVIWYDKIKATEISDAKK